MGSLQLSTMGSNKNWLRAFPMMIGATLFWFVAEAVFSTVRHYSLVQIVWTRYSVHLICMLILLGPRRFYLHARTRKATFHILRGLLMINMPFLGLAALEQLKGAEFKTVFWLIPILIVVIDRFYATRRFHIRYWAVTIIAYLGLLVIFSPGSSLFSINVILALGSALSFSLYIVLTYRLQKTESLNTNLLYTAIVVVCPLTLLLPYFWQMPTFADGGRMFMVGSLGLVALWFIEKALENSRPVNLAPMFFLIPLWGLVIRFFLKPFIPDPLFIIGVLTVMASLLAHHFMEAKAPAGSGEGT